MDAAKFKDTLVGHGGVSETIDLIKEAFRKSIPQTKNLAEQLKGSSLEESAANIWDYMHSNIRYKKDTPGEEEVRTAARTWADRHTGVDCEDMTIFAGSILANMGYPFRANVIAQNGNSNFSHIFITAGDNPRRDTKLVRGLVIDPVPPLSGFNEVAPNITKNMRLNLLEGIEGVDDIDNAIFGLGMVAKPDRVTKMLMKHQSAHLGIISGAISGIGAAEKTESLRELRKTRFAILCNGMPERDHILKILPYVKDITPKGNYAFKPGAPLEAIENYLCGVIDNGLLEESLDGLGRAKKKKKQQELDQEFEEGKKKKKPGLLKKIVRGIVRFNPLTMAARGGFLLLLRLNLFKMASKLKLGYLTKEEAEKMGLNMDEWAKLKNTLAKITKLYDKVGGKADKLKAAIMKGGKGKKVDKDVTANVTIPETESAAAKAEPVIDREPTEEDGVEGLGVLPAIPAAMTAAASLVAAVGGFMKKINFKKLVGTAKTVAAGTKNEEEADSPVEGGKKRGFLKKIFDKIKGKKGTPQNEGFENEAERVAYKEASRVSPDAPTPEGGKDNTMLYVLGAAGALGLVMMMK